MSVPLPVPGTGLRLVAVLAQGLPDSTDPGQLTFRPGQEPTATVAVTVANLRTVERPTGAAADTVTPVPLDEQLPGRATRRPDPAAAARCR